MKKIDTYFREYAAYHRTKQNKATHMIGIPLIVLSLLGLLDQIPLFGVDHLSPALLLWTAANTFYVALSFMLGLSMMVTTGVLFALGVTIPVNVLWVMFILGWVFQGIGHYKYEHKAPAFADNLIHLLIGPAYIQNLFLKIVK